MMMYMKIHQLRHLTMSLIDENIIHTPNKSADFSDSADYEGVVALLPGKIQC